MVSMQELPIPMVLNTEEKRVTVAHAILTTHMAIATSMDLVV